MGRLPVLLILVVMATAAASSMSGLNRSLRQVLHQYLQSPRKFSHSIRAIMSEIAANPPPMPVNILSFLMDVLPPIDDDISSVSVLKSFGYDNVETHYVYTEDGYRLFVERLPNRGAQPVLLAPGLQVASAAFVLLGRDRSVCTLLHTAGFDVWMLNYRGNHFSQKHRNYTVNDEEFWKFSFHEHGVYDNTAVIDLVLRETGFPSTIYVGHSMGSTSFFVMGSQRPEYNDKVLAAFLMGPAASLRHHRSPTVGLIYSLNNVTQPMLEKYKAYKTMKPLYLVSRRLAMAICSTLVEGCYRFVSLLTGYRPNSTYMKLPFYWNTYPSGGSYGQAIHYAQNAHPDMEGFRLYDHGEEKNMQMYGSVIPPEYDLTKVRAPVYLQIGHGDVLCDPRDVDFLKSQLPNAKVRYAEDPIFNHIDFITAAHAHEQVYKPMIKEMLLLSPSVRSIH